MVTKTEEKFPGFPKMPVIVKDKSSSAASLTTRARKYAFFPFIWPGNQPHMGSRKGSIANMPVGPNYVFWVDTSHNPISLWRKNTQEFECYPYRILYRWFSWNSSRVLRDKRTLPNSGVHEHRHYRYRKLLFLRKAYYTKAFFWSKEIRVEVRVMSW